MQIRVWIQMCLTSMLLVMLAFPVPVHATDVEAASVKKYYVYSFPGFIATVNVTRSDPLSVDYRPVNGVYKWFIVVPRWNGSCYVLHFEGPSYMFPHIVDQNETYNMPYGMLCSARMSISSSYGYGTLPTPYDTYTRWWSMVVVATAPNIYADYYYAFWIDYNDATYYYKLLDLDTDGTYMIYRDAWGTHQSTPLSYITSPLGTTSLAYVPVIDSGTAQFYVYKRTDASYNYVTLGASGEYYNEAKYLWLSARLEAASFVFHDQKQDNVIINITGGEVSHVVVKNGLNTILYDGSNTTITLPVQSGGLPGRWEVEVTLGTTEGDGDSGGGGGGDNSWFPVIDINSTTEVLPPSFSVGAPSLYNALGILSVALFLGLFILYIRAGMGLGQALVMSSALGALVALILYGPQLTRFFIVLFIAGLGLWRVVGK